MSDQPKKPEPKLVKNQGTKPCGCSMTEFSDGTRQIAPCMPCGLFASGEAMIQAAQALMAVATTLKASRDAAMVDNAVRGAAGRKKL